MWAVKSESQTIAVTFLCAGTMNTGEKRKRARMGAESTPDHKGSVRKRKTNTTRQRTLKDVLNTMTDPVPQAISSSKQEENTPGTEDDAQNKSVIVAKKASVMLESKSGMLQILLSSFQAKMNTNEISPNLLSKRGRSL